MCDLLQCWLLLGTCVHDLVQISDIKGLSFAGDIAIDTCIQIHLVIGIVLHGLRVNALGNSQQVNVLCQIGFLFRLL